MERKGLLDLYFQVTVYHQGMSRQELKQRLEAQIRKDVALWLSSWLALCFIHSASFQSKLTCPGMALPTAGWALLHQLIKKTLRWVFCVQGIHRFNQAKMKSISKYIVCREHVWLPLFFPKQYSTSTPSVVFALRQAVHGTGKWIMCEHCITFHKALRDLLWFTETETTTQSKQKLRACSGTGLRHWLLWDVLRAFAVLGKNVHNLRNNHFTCYEAYSNKLSRENSNHRGLDWYNGPLSGNHIYTKTLGCSVKA